jgi:hypothetical protein
MFRLFLVPLRISFDFISPKIDIGFGLFMMNGATTPKARV